MFLKEFSDNAHGIQNFLWFSDGLANRSFCRSDSSKVQLKSNWIVDKRLLASDSKTVSNIRLFLSKLLSDFFNGCFGNSSIWKELALKEPLDDVMLHSGICSDSQMTLRNNQFVNRKFRGTSWIPTEQLVEVCYSLVQKQSDNRG